MSARKSLFLFLTVFIISLSSSVATIVSANSTPAPVLTPSADNYHAPQNANYQLNNLGFALGCMGGGISLIHNQTCAFNDKDGNVKLSAIVPDGGLLGEANNVMLTLYTHPPTSTTLYLANLGSDLGIIKPAYAAGVSGQGADVLQPILQLWEIIRNLAYVVFIFVFLAVGFMIMFRQKISQQAVVSVQQALPGLVIGLILVTFSYLLSAFIVDLSFVGMGIVAAIFEPLKQTVIQDPNALVANKVNIFQLTGSFIYGGMFDNFRQNIIAPITQALFNPTYNFFKPVLSFPWNLVPFIGGPASAATLGAGLLGLGLGLVISIVIMIALIIQMFRLLWALITAYITVLVITILSPLIILAATIPGKSSILSVWWKTLLGNVLIFPAVFATFLFAGIFLGYANPADFNQDKVLPLLAFPNTLIPAIIGYGIILGSPAIPKMVKDALGVKEPQGIPQMAVAGVTAGFSPAKAGYQRATAPYARARSAWQKSEAETAAGSGAKSISNAGRTIINWLPGLKG